MYREKRENECKNKVNVENGKGWNINELTE
jgi:hypothetical protein